MVFDLARLFKEDELKLYVKETKGENGKARESIGAVVGKMTKYSNRNIVC